MYTVGVSAEIGYHSREYWEATYADSDGKLEDWLQSYAVLRPLLVAHVAPAHATLILGCGSSPLGEQLYDDGHHDLTSIDFSPTVIAAMQARATERPGMVYREMDARALAFGDRTFDAVIDKGTLDAIVCSPEPELAVRACCDEVARVLKPDGVFLSISLSSPRRRLAHLTRPEWGWSATVHTVPKKRIVESDDPEANVNWVYVLSRR